MMYGWYADWGVGGWIVMALMMLLFWAALAGDYACQGATISATTSGIPTIAEQAAKAANDGALGKETGLVTLTAGGNDVGFGAVLWAMLRDGASYAPTSA